MGRFSAANMAARQTRAASDTSDSRLTELGDPDFTSSFSSQGQVPAASAEQKLQENSRSASKVLANAEAFGYDTSGRDFDGLRQAAETGVKEQESSFIAEAIGWIDGPRQAMNLLLQDFVGGKAGTGFRDPNFGDYWNAWWSGIDDPNKFEEATGLNPISGSHTLDMFGYDEQEDLIPRIGRGIADFSLQVLTDPLTYLTFGLSGLGKKVALTAGRQFQLQTTKNMMGLLRKPAANPKTYRNALQEAAATGVGVTKYERKLAQNLDDIVQQFDDDLADFATRAGGELPPDMHRALSNYLGTDNPAAMLKTANAQEVAIANQVFKDVIRPVMNRSFKDVDKLALIDLPAFMAGGARISVPFISGNLVSPGRSAGTLQAGLLIPGTQGLGRKLVGDPIRRLSENFEKLGFVGRGYQKGINAIGKGATNMDQLAPWLRGLKNGEIEGWQYHIAEGAISGMNNNAAKHTISTELRAMWEGITKQAADAGQDLSELGRRIMYRLDASDLDEVLAAQMGKARQALGAEGAQRTGVKTALDSAHPQLDESVEKLVTYMQETMGSYHTQLGILDPEFAEQFIKGYVPHSINKNLRPIIDAFARESSGKAGQGVTEEDLWAHLLNAAGSASVADGIFGSPGHVGRRLGRGQALRLYNEGLLMLDAQTLNVMGLERQVVSPFGAEGKVITDALGEVGLTVPELNELLGPILERESKRLGVPLPNDWDGALFNENPLEVMLDYLDNMTDAINAWNLLEPLKASGLAFTHAAELNLQNVSRNIVNNAMATASTMNTLHFGRPVPGETARAPLRWLEEITQTKDAQQAVKNVSGNAETAALDRTALVPSIAERGVERPVVVEVWEDGSYRLVDGHNRVAAARLGGVTADAPVQFVPAIDVPTPKNGTVGKMKMKPGWWEEAVEAQGGHAAVQAGAAERGARGFVEGDLTWDAHQALEVLPWGADTVERNILYGGARQGAIPGVPHNVHKNLEQHGVTLNTIEDVEDARKLAGTVGSSNPEDWADDVAARQQDNPLFNVPEGLLSEKPGAFDWRTRTVGDETLHIFSEAKGKKGVQGLKKRAFAAVRISGAATPNGIRIQLRIAGKTGGEKANARLAISKWLDRAFDQGGELEGMFTQRGLDELIIAGMDEETSRLLHMHMRTKLGQLSNEAKEFISKEPAEIFDTRLLYEDTIQGINDWIRSVSGVRVGGSLISPAESMELLGTDVAVNKLRALQRAANQLGDRGYDEIATIMRDVDDYAGVQSIKDMIQPAAMNVSGPAVADVTMNRNVAEWLSLVAGNSAAIYTPEGIAAAKLAVQRNLKWWRAMATLPRAAFHIRNLVGGSWMNTAAGVQGRTMAEVSTHGIAFRNAMRNAKPGAAMEEAFNALPAGRIRNGWRAAWEENVMAGFATTEFSGALTPQAMKQRWDWANAFDVDNFILTRAGGRVMESVEDFMRMSLFMQYYDEGVEGSAKVAAELVNAVHFDYANLTPWETKAKSWIPFFVWARRNTPLQIGMAVENPRYVQRYRAMMQSMSDNLGGEDEANLQEADHFTAWASGTDYKVNPGTPFWARLMIDPDLPISDLLELPTPTPENLVEFADGLLGPHIGFLSDVNAQRELGNVNAPAPFNVVLQSLAAFGLYDKTQDGDVRMPYLSRTLLETGLPYSRELFDPVSGGPTDPNRQQRLGIKPDDDLLSRTLKSVGGQLAGGVGLKFTTPADARAAAYRSGDEIQKLIKELRLQGKLPQAEQR